MRLPSLMFAALFIAAPLAWGQGTQAPLTLSQALARADAANPVLRAKLAQLAAAEGTRRDAHSLFAYNPQVQAESTRRDVPLLPGTETQREWKAGISQTIEIAGQPGYRREAADAALQALRSEIDDLRLQQRAEVGKRFYRVLALQRRVEVESRAAATFEQAAGAVERRRAAGEDTRLDANVALVEAERARNQLSAIREQLLEARSALATPLYAVAGELPEVTGDLEVAQPAYTESQLLAHAQTQPRLQGLQARQLSAQARVRLERAMRAPDVTLGIASGREGPGAARERLTTFSVSVPLPLFRRNAGGIGAAVTEAEQATVERESAERDVPTQVRALWLRLQSLRERVQRFERTVLPALARNEELSTKSRQAGQIGLLEMLIAQRQVLDARRDLLDAQLVLITTQLTLEATAGWAAQP